MKHYNEMWRVRLHTPGTSCHYDNTMDFTSFAKAWEAYTYYNDFTPYVCELWDVSYFSAGLPTAYAMAAPPLRIA